MSLPLNLTLPVMQTQWKSQLDPVLANTLLSGQLIKNIALNDGITVIPHSLGQVMTGYIPVYQNGAAEFYASVPLNSKTLTLTSNAAITLSLWVF